MEHWNGTQVNSMEFRLCFVNKFDSSFGPVARERKRLGSNEKTGTFISARRSPKWVKAIEQPNKWMRTQEKKIIFQEPAIQAKQPTNKLDKRPKTSKRNPPILPSKTVAKAKGLKKLPITTTVLPSAPKLDYRKMVDALQYAAVAEKCILLEALRWVCGDNRTFNSNLMTYFDCSV